MSLSNLYFLTNKKTSLYLVGSQAVNRSNYKSDNDYVMVVNYKLSKIKLRDISYFFNKNLKKENVSIKFFDYTSLFRLKNQDFIRFKEYHESNYFFRKDFLMGERKVGIVDVINSIIIQVWWTIYKITVEPVSKEYVIAKLLSRIEKNYNIYIESSIGLDGLLNGLKSNFLFVKILNIVDEASYFCFLKSYFLCFEHEFVNKFYDYVSICKYINLVIENISLVFNVVFSVSGNYFISK